MVSEKRIFILILVFLLLVPVILVPVSAASSVVASGTAGPNITWRVYSDGLLTFTGYGDMNIYTSPPWLQTTTTISSVSFQEGITSISDYCCRSTSISSVVIPDSVTSIGRASFMGTDLVNVTVPSSVEFIGPDAFYNCNLTNIVLHEGLITIGAASFSSNQLTSVNIPSSVTTIGGKAFAYNKLSYLFFAGATPPAFTGLATSSDSIIYWNNSFDTMYVPVGSVDSFKEKNPSYAGYFGTTNTFADNPVITSQTPVGTTYTYQLGQQARTLSVSASVSDNGSLTYEWFDLYHTGAIATGQSFTPPTDTLGTNVYYCSITNTVPNGGGYLVSRVSSNPVRVIVVESTSTPSEPTYPDSISDSLSGIEDSLNATSPGLDSSIDDLEDASGTVDQFEDDQWNSINDNIDDVTGAFDVFTNGSLAAAFGFLGGIVNNTFDSLGNWQVVITLPLALGLILYICSRSPLNSIPRIWDQAAAEVEAVKRADMRQSEAAYRKSYEYYRENRGRNESYSARYNAEMGRKKK